MTKEDKIRKAWENWEHIAVDGGVDENGWTNYVQSYGSFNINDFEQKQFLTGASIRPNELSGIENNNGWMVLNEESYEELENGYYMWYNNTNGDWEIDDLSDTHIKNYTHFQKITVPPKPPIY
ncbi:hypothetical protein [Chryseobacterium sp. JV274]|uniref:hypothetical protein n=1 Tax=Chryseobacterium sp. JV274 TaxID=1932669 RepID=UPI0015C1D158|nr:hypothetical protein [Chryseobacterium sp. JV274]CAD0220408.1 conserved protein of unknown function [Chryseobacterium sp. JV274]